MKMFILAMVLLLILFSIAGILLQGLFRDDLAVQRSLAHFFSYSDFRSEQLAYDLRSSDDPEVRREALQISREALARDPENPFRWSHLAFALLESGKTAEARYCYLNAVARGPNQIEILRQAMEFCVRMRQPREALQHGFHILKKSPESKRWLFERYLENDFEFPDTLDYGIPPTVPIAQAYFRYVASQSGQDKIKECWDWIIGHALADDKLAAEYMNLVIRKGNPEAAFREWLGFLGKERAAYYENNFLYNSSFESEFTSSPFDWKISNILGAEARRTSDINRSGRWSLQIVFDGKENPEYRNLSQNVFLQPGKYLLRGFLRTHEISTEQGVGFRINGLRTEQVRGTSDWTKLERAFEIRQAALTRLEVFRPRSRKIQSNLSGTVWIDDLELVSTPILTTNATQ